MAARVPTPSSIRNVALVGHGHCGKTSLGEAMLFTKGVSSRLGNTVDGTSVFDYEPEEQRRGGSIASALAWVEHQDCKINILDTPGDQNFLYDALNALRGADSAIVVVSAPDGVEVGTERMFTAAGQLGLARVVFVNKMDRERADPAACLEDFAQTLGVTPIPLQVPIGRESGFRGVVGLLRKKALYFQPDGSVVEGPIPAELAAEVQHATEALVDAVASTDDALLEHYLETFELPDEDLRRGLHEAVRTGKLVPAIYGAATSLAGIRSLLDVITWACPSPLERGELALQGGGGVQPAEQGDFVGQIVHTSVDEQSGKLSLVRIVRGTVPADPVVHNPRTGETERLGTVFAVRGKEREILPQAVTGDIIGVARLKASHTGDTLCAPGAALRLEQVAYPPPMMSYTITPKAKGDADRIRSALDRLLEEDPTLSVGTDELTGALVLHGMGQAHLEMAIERMSRKFKVQVEAALPPVPYRETLKVAQQGVEGKHKKQTGGAGQFGVVYINVSPLERGAGFEFVDLIKGGAIPGTFIPSVEKGLRERMKSGFLAGYPIVDIKVELVDGKYHPVDSKDVAFQMAGSKGLRAAFEAGGTQLLEPIMALDIVVPTECMGDVMGDITGRRGRVLGMDPRGKNTVIKATAPLAEVQRFAPELKGMTGGKGSFTMELHGYEPVPAQMVERIVHASPFKRVEED